MIKKPYFVIFDHPDEEKYLPMQNEDGTLAMFGSETEAMIAGNENPLGRSNCFEVFELGGGVYDSCFLTDKAPPA